MRLRILICILLISMIFVTPSGGETNERKTGETLNVVTSITKITSTADFDAIDLGGTGDFATPWILEFNIIGTGSEQLVTIEGTSDYFIIQNSYLNFGKWGLVLNNADNGKIMASTILNNIAGGILVKDSSNNVFYNNNISLNNDIGIYFRNSDNNWVEENDIFEHNGGGNAFNNSLGLSQHTGGGAIVINPSNNITIIDNIIYDNIAYGISADQSDDLNVTLNDINNNNIGINFTRMIFATISFNEIYDHELGVKITQYDGNTILIDNDFHDNSVDIAWGEFASANESTSVPENDTITIPPGFLPFNTEVFYISILIIIPILRRRKMDKTN